MSNLEQESFAQGGLIWEGPEGLLFTGDVIRTLSSEQIAAIGDFASRLFGVEMQPVRNIDRDLGYGGLTSEEYEAVESVLAGKNDFREFAAAHGYSDMRACKVWNSVRTTDAALRRWRRGEADLLPNGAMRLYDTEEVRAFPGLRWLDADRNVIDMRSVYDFLVITEQRPEAWTKGRGSSTNKEYVRFLTDIVNDWVQPDEPLPLA